MNFGKNINAKICDLWVFTKARHLMCDDYVYKPVKGLYK